MLREFGIRLRRLRSKGTEIQSDSVSDVASHSALESYGLSRTPLFVEDAGLYIKSLGGFPGSYSSFVFRTIGCDGLLRLLQGSDSREALFISSVAYCNGGDPKTFNGQLAGHISRAPKGRGGFGFDPVFVPQGGDRALAELSLRQKCEISHRGNSLRAFGTWLESNSGG